MKNLIVLKQLIKRSLKIFLKDKAGVFFSMLAPIIILLLYILFLGDVQLSALEKALGGMQIEGKVLKAFVDGWMLAGVIAVSCLTVSFSVQSIMIKDREDGVLSDTLVSPVSRIIIKMGYLISNYVITMIICLIVVVVAFIYLACTGWYLSVTDVFAIIGMVFLSAISSCLLSSIICKFLKTSSAHGALVGILSAMLGFVTGAYMPISMFPKAVQYLTLFVPGTYSAVIFRNLFMHGALDKIGVTSLQISEALKTEYVLDLDFFGKTINTETILAIFAVTIVLAIMFYVIVEARKKKSKMIKKIIPKP